MPASAKAMGSIIIDWLFWCFCNPWCWESSGSSVKSWDWTKAFGKQKSAKGMKGSRNSAKVAVIQVFTSFRCCSSTCEYWVRSAEHWTAQKKGIAVVPSCTPPYFSVLYCTFLLLSKLLNGFLLFCYLSRCTFLLESSGILWKRW